MTSLSECLKNINITGSIRHDEPLRNHTTFRVGGPADLFVIPHNADDVGVIVTCADHFGVPLFVLGGGANVLISDHGVRGIVMYMGAFDHMQIDDTTLVCGAGASISAVTEFAAEQGLRNLQFLYSMPGSVGGAVWMNARCYGHAVEDILSWVDVITADRMLERYHPCPADFSYKHSPFQTNGAIILQACFAMQSGDPIELRTEMERCRADRESKGHFTAPSAGSIFKNDRAFGSPSGALIDSIALRGLQIGGARVSDRHANIIVNTGNATAQDIRALIEEVAKRVHRQLGYELEREVLYIGDWD